MAQVSPYVFTFWVSYCDVRYDFRIKTMLGSPLPPVVCRSDHVFFTLFVFAYVKWCPTHTDYMSNMAIVLWEERTAFPSRMPGFASGFWWGSCCSSFVVFCVVFFVLFVFVLCLVCPMLQVSLDCPFSIAPSLFSNVYSEL
jgi:hypothetical protein